MSHDDNPMDRLALARAGRDTIGAWATYAQGVRLLSALHERGWTAFLTRPRDVDALVEFSGLAEERVRAVLGALTAYGVVEKAGKGVQLAAVFAELMREDAWSSLDEILGETEMMSRLVQDALRPAGPVPASSDDALTIAAYYGFRATPVARVAVGRLLDALPEFVAAIRTGRLLDVGCGIAGGMLTEAALLPGLRAVGIELVAEVAAEARRRAALLGVADRVEIRAMDARDLDAVDEFDACFWAQPFFPDPTRQDTLAAIRRALKPGGLLLVQEMETEPDEGPEVPAFALRRLVFEAWEVPFARTAEQLADEAKAAGFEVTRVAPTILGRVLVLHRPVAAGRRRALAAGA